MHDNKKFQATFFCQTISAIDSGSDSELLFEASIDKVVPLLTILLLHVMEVLTRFHRYEVPVPEPLQFLFKPYHGM